jgi:hypothetical protein
MRNCMNYLQQYIPISGMYFFMYDPDLNVAHWLASIIPVNMPDAGTTISLPHKYWDELKERFS